MANDGYRILDLGEKILPDDEPFEKYIYPHETPEERRSLLEFTRIYHPERLEWRRYNHA